MFRTPFPRVALVPATVPLLDALASDRAEFSAMIGSAAPDAWPQFPEAIGFTRDVLTEHPEQGEWWMWFFVEEATGLLVGSGGYVGPPRDRTVEIGYEVAPAFRDRGLGVGAAAALVDRAVETGEVDAVIAHTLPLQNPSTRVLVCLGFSRAGEAQDPDAGTVWRWRWDGPDAGSRGASAAR
ncbi:MAG TPA: GNAT family protein [Naasia sp.]|jgi:RimJ/RimL family protein N-acetyltransferase